MLPSITGVLGKDKAAHLLRRATFSPSKIDIEMFSTLTVEQAISKLLITLEQPNSPIINIEDELSFEVFQGGTLEQMRNSGTSCLERMTYFYHAHLPADYKVVPNAKALYYQNELYRFYALGSYKTLFEKVCVDNSMLVYIDNTLNDKESPNENFAREMFELYSIGKGPQVGPSDYTNYTEDDIKEAARVLTGFKHNKHNEDFIDLEDDSDYFDVVTSLPKGGVQLNKHDVGEKVFSDNFGGKVIQPNVDLMDNGKLTIEAANDELHQLIEMIFEQEETARHLCRKLYRFFCYYKITDNVENDIIRNLATTLKSNDYDVSFVLRELFASEHFFDMDDSAKSNGVVGALIKSPMELIIGTFNVLGVTINTEKLDQLSPVLIEWLGLQGLNYYLPIDVAGYPPYHQTPAYARNWIYPNSLARRYEFAALLIEGVKVTTGETEELILSFDVVKFTEQVVDDPGDGADLVRTLIDYLFVKPVPTNRSDYFLNDILLDNISLVHWREEWELFGKSGDNTAVKKQLNSLIIGLLQSPEYQLF